MAKKKRKRFVSGKQIMKHYVPLVPDAPTAILALDLGATTGWAVMGQDGLMSGTWNVGVKITNMAVRCKNLRIRLHLLREMCGGLQAIYFEEVMFMPKTSAKTMRAYGGYEAIISLFAARYKIPLIGVGVTQLKKHATGKGNAPKKLVESAVKSWGIVDHVIDDNHADALALLDYALSTDYNGSISRYIRMVNNATNTP